MKVTLESTDKIVELSLNGQTLPARVWEGQTANGIRCHAYVTRIACDLLADAAEFERDLKETKRPSPAVAAISARLVI